MTPQLSLKLAHLTSHTPEKVIELNCPAACGLSLQIEKKLSEKKLEKSEVHNSRRSEKWGQAVSHEEGSWRSLSNCNNYNSLSIDFVGPFFTLQLSTFFFIDFPVFLLGIFINRCHPPVFFFFFVQGGALTLVTVCPAHTRFPGLDKCALTPLTCISRLSILGVAFPSLGGVIEFWLFSQISFCLVMHS